MTGRALAGALALLTPVLAARADVTLPSIINHNMVLQHGMKVPLWGWAEPGETVTVTLEGQSTSTQAAATGDWSLKLPAHKPGGPFDLTIAGRNSITLTNVLFGEVWLCSGQSNMGYGVGGVAPSAEVARLNYPMMRQYFMQIRPTNAPIRKCVGNWRAATPPNAGEFCAVGFWFAERLQRDVNVPVGLIWTAYGSSSIETWIPREALKGDPDFAEMFERAKKADYPRLLAEYNAAMTNWEARAAEARQQNKPQPAKPGDPKEMYAYIMRHAPGNCFDGGIAPVIPFAARGVLWYQGEHNAPRGYQYRKLLPILIREWRRQWENPDMVFLVVQLPNYGGTGAEPRDSEWAELREAQWLAVQDTRNCGIAVTIDIGDTVNIHPPNKWDVGRRLALVALHNVYGQAIEYSGPTLSSAAFKGNEAVLSFSHADGGLVTGTNGLAEPVRGFAVAGKDRTFKWADARIKDQTVILSNTNGITPVAVRYAWDNTPNANLYNKAGLPAAPFRTDDWPGITVTNR
jgi:sialate O-acetylesterase